MATKRAVALLEVLLRDLTCAMSSPMCTGTCTGTAQLAHSASLVALAPPFSINSGSRR
ncbi:hypothetical protein PF005_g18204 [Phytophthora fragariae]|uniref:Secreted protein n=2 Tax=Phytophthora TaxID=4783 RepID=A0A6A3X187_9STRA|nr:hypothetical protein PF003_g27042 [Phytophthora fragariae]KAE9010819.1 hypothetical protein PR002_g15258 [Phytophthora rubi]KAE8930664.1 hypothetical protein PF009_g19256 [Phytophthora fragariae]KAE8993558.1 hypothetical protein PF011_g17094 [Phytophthora fragariae]KAE9015764.1 hypothetical protein PR001_g14824 [Phytophthora rubi]